MHNFMALQILPFSIDQYTWCNINITESILVQLPKFYLLADLDALSVFLTRREFTKQAIPKITIIFTCYILLTNGVVTFSIIYYSRQPQNIFVICTTDIRDFHYRYL
jgi:hypothetical protein